MSAELLNDFVEQVEVEYEGELYLVRDNGAVYRRSRPGERRRKLDDEWTFGRPEKSKGYMVHGSHVVHRIVAFAFHRQPSPQHVVDHIDTNRANNRAANLRWLTRLENVLLNPITRKRVIQAYGSLEAFFRDPSAVVARDPEFSWMRTVSKTEAEESRKRLLNWAESAPAPKGGRLGEWVYRAERPSSLPAAPLRDIQSATPNAVQRNWKIVCEFPACPESIGSDAVVEYAAALNRGSVFSRNTFGEALAEIVGHRDSILGVVCRMPPTSVKGWTFAQVTVENEKFVHESLGSFFSLDGALNAFNKLLGIDAPHVETIDDYS